MSAEHESCRPGLRISVPCSHHHISESEADAARQFPPPDMSLYMSLGFPSQRTTRSIFLRIPIRFGKWKLAQEGSPLARKRSSMNILAASPCSPRALPLPNLAPVPWGPYPSKTMLRFPLTTLKLSRRITAWTSGGTLLKLQRPL
jgi:hypothetical protein